MLSFWLLDWSTSEINTRSKNAVKKDHFKTQMWSLHCTTCLLLGRSTSILGDSLIYMNNLKASTAIFPIDLVNFKWTNNIRGNTSRQLPMIQVYFWIRVYFNVLCWHVTLSRFWRYQMVWGNRISKYKQFNDQITMNKISPINRKHYTEH